MNIKNDFLSKNINNNDTQNSIDLQNDIILNKKNY